MVTEETVQREISPLRHLHNTQTSLEKFRIALGNRVSAVERGVDDIGGEVPEIYDRLHKMAKEMENEIDSAIASELTNWSVYNNWLKNVRGIGPSLSGQLLALLLPPIPEKGPSSWIKAAGLAAEERPDGQRRLPRARVGEGKIKYHPYLRRCLYNVATSMVRQGNYYRGIYEKYKARIYETHNGDENWPPIRIDRAARWKMITIFLAHLWQAWCESEGIRDRGPYGLTVLPDGTKVIRITFLDGGYQDHEYEERPLFDGKMKI